MSGNEETDGSTEIRRGRTVSNESLIPEVLAHFGEGGDLIESGVQSPEDQHGTLDLTVVDATGDKFEEVTVPDDVAVHRIVPKLVELLRLPATGPYGQPIAYQCFRGGKNLPIFDSKTLAQAGVKNDDVLRIHAEVETPPAMDLTVVDDTGKTEEVTVSGDVASGRLVRKLVELMQLPVTINGQPLSYKFFHGQSGREIAENETLEQAGLKDDDRLRLVAKAVMPPKTDVVTAVQDPEVMGGDEGGAPALIDPVVVDGEAFRVGLIRQGEVVPFLTLRVGGPGGLERMDGDDSGFNYDYWPKSPEDGSPISPADSPREWVDALADEYRTIIGSLITLESMRMVIKWPSDATDDSGAGDGQAVLPPWLAAPPPGFPDHEGNSTPPEPDPTLEEPVVEIEYHADPETGKALVNPETGTAWISVAMERFPSGSYTDRTYNLDGGRSFNSVSVFDDGSYMASTGVQSSDGRAGGMTYWFDKDGVQTNCQSMSA